MVWGKWTRKLASSFFLNRLADYIVLGVVRRRIWNVPWRLPNCPTFRFSQEKYSNCYSVEIISWIVLNCIFLHGMHEVEVHWSMKFLVVIDPPRVFLFSLVEVVSYMFECISIMQIDNKESQYTNSCRSFRDKHFCSNIANKHSLYNMILTHKRNNPIDLIFLWIFPRGQVFFLQLSIMGSWFHAQQKYISFDLHEADHSIDHQKICPNPVFVKLRRFCIS